jgi:imidazole glycerol-phosphate synthase subunit HisH
VSRTVEIVRTGTANLASVIAAIERQDVRASITAEKEVVKSAQLLVLPGVGAFGAAIAELAANDLIDPLRDRISRGMPTLAICLGLQLFAESSEESPGAEGLSLIEGTVRRFPNTVRVPQLGWNEVQPESGEGIVQKGYAYFANSYRLTDPPRGFRASVTQHAGPFVSAFERGPIVACQFHPELSGAWGASLIARWIAEGSLW